MMDALSEQMIEYYRRRAPIYDESMGYTDACRWRQHSELVGFLREELAGLDVLEIACGPGHWTQAVAPTLRSIVATDINEAALAQARNKQYPPGCVTFVCADAYSLTGVQGVFNGGFAVDWWSHIPKSRVRPFLEGFHKKLAEGARVVFIDQLPREAFDRMFLRYDSEGNLIQCRWLPSGQRFDVIKNFPKREELFAVLNDIAVECGYFVHAPTRRWVLVYTVASAGGGAKGHGCAPNDAGGGQS